jgi:hypothetical protein
MTNEQKAEPIIIRVDWVQAHAAKAQQVRALDKLLHSNMNDRVFWSTQCCSICAHLSNDGYSQPGVPEIYTTYPTLKAAGFKLAR